MIVDTVNVRSLFRRKNLAPYKSCHPHQKILISLDIGGKDYFFSVSNLFKYANLIVSEKNFLYYNFV